MKKYHLFYISILTVLLFSTTALAHSGRTNSQGCHNNRKTGDYHCHNNGYKAKHAKRVSTSAKKVARKGSTKKKRLATASIVARNNTKAQSAQRYSPLILAIQKQLQRLDYYTGTTNGIMDEATYQAILNFQIDNRLHADGFPSDFILGKLKLK